jgi:hypothetical protein
VDRFAAGNKIPVVRFGKNDRKIDVMRPYLARQAGTGRAGVAAIGIAQEFQNVFVSAQRKGHNGIPWFSFLKADRRVTCFYFYVWDAVAADRVRPRRWLLAGAVDAPGRGLAHPGLRRPINGPDDLRCHRRLPHLDELSARARDVNRRLLDNERVGQGCVLASPAFERVAPRCPPSSAPPTPATR